MKSYWTPLIMAMLNIVCGTPSRSDKEQAALITPGDTVKTPAQVINLPEPYATKSTVRHSKVIGWPANTTPKAPNGFNVSVFASGLENPRWLYVLPNGDVLVAETKKESNAVEKVAAAAIGMTKAEGKSKVVNRITLFRDSDNDGKPDKQTIFLDGLHMPFGMALVGKYFYVANTDAVWRYPYKSGETSISGGERILNLPDKGRHWTRNLITNAAGTKLYVAVGSASNVAEDGIDKEERRACILEVNPDGSGERIYASGLRNPVGMAWYNGVLWTAVNERDELGDELVPDYITSVREGGFYGWPYSYFGNHKDPRIKPKDQRDELVQKAIVPDVPVGNHTASLGLAFYTKDVFPAKYHYGAFIGQHGSWNSSKFTGYKVAFVPFCNGKACGGPEDFLVGFIADEVKNEVYGRPVGVVLLADGSILVADDAGNTIWRVSYQK